MLTTILGSTIYRSFPPSFAPILSSAKDQLSNTAVAVKKIAKPFSTPVLSKRTYRELKLLKHIRHENVSSRLNRPLASPGG